MEDKHIQAKSPLVSNPIISFTIYSSNQNSTPQLSWTSTKGFESDGVNPDQGNVENSFEFRVKYTNASGDAPAKGYPRVQIKKGDAEIDGSLFNMARLQGRDYEQDVVYSYTTASSLVAGSDYSYWFEEQDGKGSAATAEPLTVIDPLIATSTVVQKIGLNSLKLNLVSFNVQPADVGDTTLDSVETLLVAQDGAGQFYIPPYFVNTIGNVDLSNGYQVYYAATKKDTIVNAGNTLKPDTMG